MQIRLIISAVVLCALPLAGWAQDTTPPTDNGKAELAKYADKKVTLVFEDVSMTTALRALMKTVQADFVIDPVLDKSLVNTKLTNLRFPVALDILLKSGTPPADFTVTNGVFRFVLRKEVPPPPPPAEEPPAADNEPFLPYIVRHPLRNADAERLAAFLNGNPFYSEPPPGVVTGSVSGHGNYSTNGFDNGKFTVSGGNYNQNFGNGNNNSYGSGYNWSGMLNQFLGGILGGGRRR